MEEFLNFLKCAKSFLQNLPVTCTPIRLTLGNEACDLDSTIAPLFLGFLRHKTHPEELVVPILNCTETNFPLHTENCFVLKQANVALSDLVFCDQVPVEALTSKYQVKVSLVDHHILAKNDQVFAGFVDEIFDHRPVDSSYEWGPQVRVQIEPVGSCCTLIGNEILKSNNLNILTKPLAYLLYQVIIFDTIALNPEAQKVTPLDIQVVKQLQDNFGFTSDYQILFDQLWAEHNNVSQLTPYQLLHKDLKVVEGVFMPGLPTLVEEYLNLKGGFEAVEQFAQDHKASCVLLVGMHAANNQVKRDLAVYSPSEDDTLKTVLLNSLQTKSECDLKSEKRQTKFDGKIYLLHVHNIKVSRKQLIPIVKTAWNIYKSNKVV